MHKTLEPNNPGALVSFGQAKQLSTLLASGIWQIGVKDALVTIAVMIYISNLSIYQGRG